MEITNDNNLPTDKYLYNSSNQLIQREHYEYDSQTNEITEKQTYLFSYNSTGSIITIERKRLTVMAVTQISITRATQSLMLTTK